MSEDDFVDGGESATATATRPKGKKNTPKAAPKKAAASKGAGNESAMSDKEIATIVRLLKKVSDPTRLKIVNILSINGSMNVGQLCDFVGAGQPGVSHHLSLMKDLEIVRVERDGKNNNYSLGAAGKVLAQVANRCLKSIQED
jgi:DNA-binding transcriptional ArsR family regulator